MSSEAKIQGKTGHIFTNWAGSISCKPEIYFEPQNRDELKQILSMAQSDNRKVRVVGVGHSYPELACTTDFMVNMKHFNTLLNVDAAKEQVTAEAGITLEDMFTKLDQHKLAYSVLPVISDATLAGAILTGTHGSGIEFGTMASYVVSLELMTSSGEVKVLSQSDDNPDDFSAACVSLGCMGVVLSFTIQCEPAFNLENTTFGVRFDDIVEQIPDQMKASEHMTITWFPRDHCVVKHLRRTDKPVSKPKGSFLTKLIGVYLREFLMYICSFIPSLTIAVNNFYYRIISKGSGETVDVSHKQFMIPGLLPSTVCEWNVPVDKAAVVLKELKKWLHKSKYPANFPIEIRFSKGDTHMLSPAYNRDACYIQLLSNRPYGKAVPTQRYWTALREIVKTYGGRPHWGKEHNLTEQDFKSLYPQWTTFQVIRKKYDPSGMFMNSYLERIFTSRKVDFDTRL